MNENLYASPEPVEEESVQSQYRQQNRLAWGLWLILAGMVIFIVTSFASRTYFYQVMRPQFLDHYLSPTHIIELEWDLLMAIPLAGMILCAAGTWAPGRMGWIALASAACISLLPLSHFNLDKVPEWFLYVTFAGFWLWGVFLKHTAWTMKIPYANGCARVALLILGGCILWHTLQNDILPKSLRMNGDDAVTASLFFGYIVMIFISTWYLRRGILRGLRTRQKTENENE